MCTESHLLSKKKFTCLFFLESNLGLFEGTKAIEGEVYKNNSFIFYHWISLFVGVAGTTELGIIDPIEELSKNSC